MEGRSSSVEDLKSLSEAAVELLMSKGSNCCESTESVLFGLKSLSMSCDPLLVSTKLLQRWLS
jgi:hypothetical protein